VKTMLGIWSVGVIGGGLALGWTGALVAVVIGVVFALFGWLTGVFAAPQLLDDEEWRMRR